MKYVNGETVKVGDIACHKGNIEHTTTMIYFTISDVSDNKVECFRDDVRLSFTLSNLADCYLIKRESDVILDNVINSIELLKYKLPDNNEILNRVLSDLKNILHKY